MELCSMWLAGGDGQASRRATTGEQEADKPVEVVVQRLTIREPREMQVDGTREDFPDELARGCQGG